MEPSELLRRIVEILERLGLRYFVTGSMATLFAAMSSRQSRSWGGERPP
jgi:hypothetical protein